VVQSLRTVVTRDTSNSDHASLHVMYGDRDIEIQFPDNIIVGAFDRTGMIPPIHSSVFDDGRCASSDDIVYMLLPRHATKTTPSDIALLIRRDDDLVNVNGIAGYRALSGFKRDAYATCRRGLYTEFKCEENALYVGRGVCKVLGDRDLQILTQCGTVGGTTTMTTLSTFPYRLVADEYDTIDSNDEKRMYIVCDLDTAPYGRFATCKTDEVYDVTRLSCVPVNRCKGRVNGPLHLVPIDGEKYIMCTNGMETIRDCTIAYNHGRLNEFGTGCVDAACIEIGDTVTTYTAEFDDHIAFNSDLNLSRGCAAVG